MTPARWLGSPLRRALAGTVGASLGLQAALLVSGVLTARLLGVEGRGYLALLMLVPLALAPLAGLGLPLAVVFEVSRAPAAARNIVRRVTGVVAVQVVVLLLVQALVLALVLDGEPDAVQQAALLTLPVGVATLLEQYALGLLQAQGNFSAFNLLRLLPFGLYGLLVAVAFVLGIDELGLIVLMWAGTYLLGTAVTVRHAWRRLPPASDGAPNPGSPAMLRFGAKSLFGSASPIETFRVDQAIIGIFLAPVALGVYVTALAFTNLPRFIALAIGAVAYPDVAAQTDMGSARRRMWRFFVLALIPCGLLVAILEVVAEWLVLFFFGQEFRDAVAITRILLVGALFLAARRVLTDASRGAGLPSVGSLSEVVSWALLVPAVLVGASLAGVTGVAIALVFSAILSLIMLVAAVLVAGRRSEPEAPSSGGLPTGSEAAAQPVGEPGPA